MSQEPAAHPPYTETASGASARRLRARYRRVVWFFGRHLLSVVIWDLGLRRIGLGRLARRNAESRYRGIAARFRGLATELGGVWIKVGQFLSARVDVLPAAITEELAELQDDVPAEPFEALRQVLLASFPDALEAHFAELDPEPMASASLGQVHRARLVSGERVVVKIQRPGIDDLLRVDLAALRTVVTWLKRYRAITRRADLDGLLAEFSRTLWEEVDYVAEAGNAERFAAMFAASREVRIPAVYRAHSTRQVLTLEDVYFIKITDYAAIESSGVDRSQVARRLMDTYLRQIFLEGFFHADPHPGNLFVEPDPENGWRLVFVDFGMVGSLTEEARAGLRDLAIGVGTRDVERLLHAYQTLGVLLPSADMGRIRQAETAMFSQVWGRSMRELTHMDRRQMHEFAHQFRDLLYDMPFQVPTDLIFLGRCVAILSGMCTGLDPDFNLFDGLAPFARRLMQDERGDWMDTILEWLSEEAGLLARLPKRLDSTLTRLEDGTLTVTARAAPSLEMRLSRLTRALDRLVWAVVFGALLLVGALLFTAGERTLGGVGLILAILAFIRMLLPGRH
jgi:predicted unusual protein kinase regulating ubiquinone biosynthesis (AarF/ABC1/UbiB family)